MISTDILNQKYDTIIAWGAGRVFETYDESLPITCIVDTDSKKWGQFVKGIEIRNPDYLYQLGRSETCAVIITTKKYVLEIVEEIRSKNYNIDFFDAEVLFPQPFSYYCRNRCFSEYAEDAIIKGICERQGIKITHI